MAADPASEGEQTGFRIESIWTGYTHRLVICSAHLDGQHVEALKSNKLYAEDVKHLVNSFSGFKIDDFTIIGEGTQTRRFTVVTKVKDPTKVGWKALSKCLIGSLSRQHDERYTVHTSSLKDDDDWYNGLVQHGNMQIDWPPVQILLLDPTTSSE
jgi:hypothetical protein